jgi:hypothetical protein
LISNPPYISIVITGRNDDYGEDFLTRINTFVRSLDHQVRRHADLFELIVVEWNPLPDYAPLIEVLADTTNLPVTVITVPSELHDSLGSTSPVLEFHGKNVGIRRARGEFVLVTNPDILFTQELIDEMAKKNLRLDTVYRTDRYDFNIAGIADIDSSDLIDFAVQNTFVVHAMSGNHSVSLPVLENQRDLSLLPRSNVSAGIWHTNGCGDFMLASRESFFTVRGLYETVQHRWHVDSISLMRFQAAQVRQYVFVSPLCIFHQHHDRKPQDVSFANLDVIGLAQQSGHTDWGFPNCKLPEITKEIQ